MKLCYVINLYPKPSHSFIRREILALEQHGAQVLRVAFRGWDEPAADPRDAAEQALTRYTLRSGLVGLGVSVFRNMLLRPIRFLKAASQAWHMGRKSDKPLWRHVMYLAEGCVVADEVRRFGATHIHAHFGTNSAEVALLASLLAASAVQLHGAWAGGIRQAGSAAPAAQDPSGGKGCGRELLWP